MPGTTTSEFFHGYAHDFDAIYGNKNTLVNSLINRYLRRSMRLRYEKTLEGCTPIEGKTVIDIGCGPGHYSVALAARGAAKVFGLDFAKGMIDIARANAEKAGVADRCTFAFGDFLTYPITEKFDYAVVMGFMDYIADPRALIERVLSMTTSKAFFSFPVDGGVLAWQRKLRYKRRCDLYMYNREQLRELFAGLPYRDIHVEQIDRDYFVTVTMG
jgi:2-polyprenyl-3-methyl-5-hydroxy-6-metoxy-1,4-benzoquinol methylase